jgi:hypothetical protein
MNANNLNAAEQAIVDKCLDLGAIIVAGLMRRGWSKEAAATRLIDAFALLGTEGSGAMVRALSSLLAESTGRAVA